MHVMAQTDVSTCRFGTGAAGPAFFGMGVKQSLIVLLVVDLMYVATFKCRRDDSQAD